MTGIGGCCARAASGMAAALPKSIMNSRLCMSALASGGSIVSAQWTVLVEAKIGHDAT
jgi:hypothetical protein